jgi:hypothetical protein
MKKILSILVMVLLMTCDCFAENLPDLSLLLKEARRGDVEAMRYVSADSGWGSLR